MLCSWMHHLNETCKVPHGRVPSGITACLAYECLGAPGSAKISAVAVKSILLQWRIQGLKKGGGGANVSFFN